MSWVPEKYLVINKPDKKSNPFQFLKAEEIGLGTQGFRRLTKTYR